MKTKSKHLLALLLTGALLTGLMPVGTGTESQAAEQPALKNPRIIKTVEEVARSTTRGRPSTRRRFTPPSAPARR